MNSGFSECFAKFGNINLFQFFDIDVLSFPVVVNNGFLNAGKTDLGRRTIRPVLTGTAAV